MFLFVYYYIKTYFQLGSMLSLALEDRCSPVAFTRFYFFINSISFRFLLNNVSLHAVLKQQPPIARAVWETCTPSVLVYRFLVLLSLVRTGRPDQMDLNLKWTFFARFSHKSTAIMYNIYSLADWTGQFWLRTEFCYGLAGHFWPVVRSSETRSAVSGKSTRTHCVPVFYLLLC